MPGTIPLFKVRMPHKTELLPALEATLYSGYVGQGAKVAEFETALAAFLGSPNVLTVNSGTSALQLAMRLADVRGGTVVTTPMTCAATNLPVLAEGGRPVWADIDPATGNIDPVDVARKITPATRAVLAVHWGGQPADLTELAAITGAYGIPLIEDAAHALGGEWNGRKIGDGTADFTCFSLQAIKHITTGDGGILVTRDRDAFERGKRLRWYGIDRDLPREDNRIEQDITEPGLKWHMNDVTATIGLAQLPYLPDVVAKHRANAAFYADAFAGVVPYTRDLLRGNGAWWLFTVLLDDERDRARFAAYMTAAGVAVSRVHARNDIHTCFAAYRDRKLPGVDEFSARMCCIPVHAGLSEQDRQRVAAAVTGFRRWAAA
jgi:dTDP-4-amino-4,6-dideoxygalactose transaminase